MKRCSTCGEGKPLADFWKQKGKPDGLQSRCKACASKANRRYWRDLSPETIERYRIDERAKRYGITGDEYRRLFDEQGGACAICGERHGRGPSAKESSPAMLCIDHDHDSGVVRGLLCGRCNVAVGQLRNDPSLAERAAEYLRRRA